MSHRLERLETRRLLSGIYSKTDFSSYVHRIFGTAGDDHLIVSYQIAYSFGPSMGEVPGSIDLAARNGYAISVREAGSDMPIWFGITDVYPSATRIYLRGGNDTVTFVAPDPLVNSPYPFPGIYVDAGDGDDQIIGTAGRDTIFGGSGKDTLVGGAGNDSLVGDSGADSLDGSDGNDTIDAGGGNDFVRPGTGQNIVLGGAGDDRFSTADRGSSSISGQGGDDTLFSGRAADAFFGNAGTDTVDYRGRREDLFIDISDEWRGRLANLDPIPSNSPHPRNNNLYDDGRSKEKETFTDFIGGRATISTTRAYVVPDSEAFSGTGGGERDSFGDVERAIGGDGDDVILGSQYANTLDGGAGDDSIFAGGGQDDVYGNDGDDSLFTVDTRDGFPTTYPNGRHEASDIVDGGAGKDFARVDLRDLSFVKPDVENIEHLRELTM